MNDKEKDKRWFPRIDTECPVIYALGSSKKWHVATLMNFSATGIKMKCKEPLLKNINITIMLKPGQNRLVPEFLAKGIIIRCNMKTEGEYEVSCKLIEVKPKSKASGEENR
ncbi:MAG: PilZ domain-containing protein [Gammaproteobacteria bacterium]|nr:PilZ domain-containing protein [Gammaproteobacteria bacterium]MDH5799349.1 PilZ domain-containing protein [Gammaproteobacteria bacterium]